MKKAGVDDRVAGELADLYTPEMAKLCKPPKVVIENRTQAYNSSENKLILKPNMSLNDIRVLRHEMTHWWHYRIIEKHPEIQAELAQAAAADLKTIKKLYSKKRSDFMVSNAIARDKVAKEMFRVDGGWDSLTEEEKKEACKFFDSVGSISSGELGGMHGGSRDTVDDYRKNRDYFLKQNTDPRRCNFGEVIASLGEYVDERSKLKIAFKETYAIFEKYRKL